MTLDPRTTLLAFASVLSATSLFAQDLKYTLESPSLSFGETLETVADYDGDGVRDIFVGDHRNGAAAFQAGAASIFSGAGGGLPLWQTNGPPNSEAHFGVAATELGDVNADGFPDIAVGAPEAHGTTIVDAGTVTIVSGRFIATQTGAQFLSVLEGPARDDRFGQSLGRMDDLDGDGIDELVVGAPGTDVGGSSAHGMVYVFSGATNQLLISYTGVLLDPGAALGAAVCGIGDVTGDGVADLAAGSPGDNDNGVGAGAVYVLSGADGSVVHKIFGTSTGDAVGAIVAAADLNLDGIDEILVGIPFRDVPGNDQGMLQVFQSSDGLPYTPALIGEGAADMFATTLSAGGDVNGDGRPDVLIGAPRANPNDSGSFYLVSGDEFALGFGAPVVVSERIMDEVDGPTTSDFMGRGVLIHPSVDGDAGDEVVVGRRTSMSQVDVYCGSSWFVYPYCPAAPNSAGPGALLAHQGTTSVSAADFELIATGCPPGVAGLFFYGRTRVRSVFGDGFRCAGGQTVRIQPIASADGTGMARRVLDFSAPYAAQLVPGASRSIQYWFRDPMGPGGTGFNTSSALSATFQP